MNKHAPKPSKFSVLMREQRLLPMLVLFSLLLAILLALSNATENSARFGVSYSWLLVASAVSLLLLSVLIGFSLRRLIRRYRYREPGSRLTLRLVLVFVAISAAPLAVVYYFSVHFIQRGIESWFDVRIEVALEDALELSRTALDMRTREVLRQSERMAESLTGIDEGMAGLSLDDLLSASDAAELTLFGQSGRIIATAGSDSTVIVPDQPSELTLLQVQQGHSYVALEPIRDVGFHIRVMLQVPNNDPRRETMYFQALYQIPERVSRLADSVQTAFDEYKELVFLRGPLKTSFIGALSLVLLFGILSAVWAALYSARRLVEPIRDLAEGTRAVAAGQYDRQLSLPSNDELGFLVHSFNQMMRKLSQARDDAEQSRMLVEQQRAFLEVVLSRLSTGVMTLDHNGVLYTHNAAASHILNVDLSAVSNDTTQPSHLRQFFTAIQPHLTAAQPVSETDWRQEITLFSQQGRQVLMCRGSSLPDSVGFRGGYVLVFDDITTLLRAQRDAAWTEVARRLAHEIKNPLTPIQLAAERLRHKYLSRMEPDAARVLDRSTHTIVQQVQAMKDMVNAFNEYAKPPTLNLSQVTINEFIADVLYLYKDHPSGVSIALDLDPANPQIQADRGRLRQLLHNLVQNAIEALAQQPDDGGGDSGAGQIAIHTRCLIEEADANSRSVELRIDDNGPGFPHSEDGGGDIGDVFEPYVTTKTKGTGLGLAIVKKIVEEHGGLIELGHNTASRCGGARVTIRFPAITTPPREETAVNDRRSGEQRDQYHADGHSRNRDSLSATTSSLAVGQE